MFDQSQSLTLNSGSIYLNNNSVGTINIPTLTLNGDTNMSVDVDLQTKTMDRIKAETYNVKEDAHLNVNNLVLMSDAEQDITHVLFADPELANNVTPRTGKQRKLYRPKPRSLLSNMEIFGRIRNPDRKRPTRIFYLHPRRRSISRFSRRLQPLCPLNPRNATSRCLRKSDADI